MGQSVSLARWKVLVKYTSDGHTPVNALIAPDLHT